MHRLIAAAMKPVRTSMAMKAAAAPMAHPWASVSMKSCILFPFQLCFRFPRGRSRDNGAYVRLLWSGKTQSAVTLASSLANFRAILVTIGGSDDVAEGSTVVWSPNGKTFDVCAAFVVDTGNFRVMRMRLYGSGTSLNPTVVDGQNAGGYTSSTTYLHSVVGLV